MNPDIKQKWLEALRSGNYKQGVGKLRKVSKGCDEWCCLGVLCHIVKPDGWTPDFNTFSELTSYTMGEAVAFPPVSVRNDSGLTQDQESLLVQMNDGQRKSFAEIADFIEKHW